MAYIALDHVEKLYHVGEVTITAVSDISFTVDKGEFVVVVGPSGGEQQRVAIARALAKNPKLLLCDEPTGALDYVTGKAILKLLQDTCRQQGMTVIVITHNTAIAPMADKVIHVKNGQVEQIDLNPNPLPVEEIEW